MSRIAVIGGGGYVGVSYAAVLAELGYEVIGLDLDDSKVIALSEGRSPIYEPGLDELLQRGLQSGCLRFTSDYATAVPAADFAFVCVGTPPDARGRADMKYVQAAAASIGRHATGHTIIVNKSTMPIGSAHFVANILAENSRPEVTFSVVSNPEFLREGNAIQDIFQPDRIVIGAQDDTVANKVAALYAPLGAPVLVTDVRSAEMIKYASNAFLATKISFINEIARICEHLEADVDVVAKGVGMDERIGPRFLRAGAGFGGSCFPKDVRALASMAQDAGVDPAMLNAVLATNVSMRRHVLQKVQMRLGGLRGKRVAIFGLAFKPDTDDTRESPALAIIEDLLAAGAHVSATDPVALESVARLNQQLNLVADPYAAAMGVDAVVLMTEWDEYKALDFTRLRHAMRGRAIVDARNVLAPDLLAEAGLLYDGIGRKGALPVVKTYALDALTAIPETNGERLLA